MQYSDEVQGMCQTKMNGQAFGFTAQAKNFTLNDFTSPTLAVQRFISPGSGFNTICDCREYSTPK